MGILCGYSLFLLRRTRARTYVCVWVRGGWFYFTRIIIPLEDRAPIPSSRRVESEPRRISASRRLFMDGFSFNFRQSISFVVLTDLHQILPPDEEVSLRGTSCVLYATFDRLKRHGGKQGLLLSGLSGTSKA